MAMTQEKRERYEKAKVWIFAEAEKPNGGLLETLAERRRNFLGGLDDLTEEQTRFSPGEGKWSIMEVGRHMANANRGSMIVVALLLKGKRPEGDVKMGLMDEPASSFQEVIDANAKALDKIEAALGRFAGDYDTTTTYAHPFFGELNTRQWVTFCFVHLAAHINQIKRIKGSPGYPD